MRRLRSSGCVRGPRGQLSGSRRSCSPLRARVWASIRPPVRGPMGIFWRTQILSFARAGFLPFRTFGRIYLGARGSPLSSNVPREQDMILKEFSQILAEELEGPPPPPGDASRPLGGLSGEESADGWLGPAEGAVPSR